MSNFYERIKEGGDFYDDVRKWFSEWYDDLDEFKKLEYYNKAMDNLMYPGDVLYENTEEAVNNLFSSPYEALIEQRNGDYNVSDKYYSYPDLYSYNNIPYSDYIEEILNDMINNPAIYKVFIEHLYEDEQN